MKLEVSKRDAYIMAETLWEAAMDLDIAAKGNREQARICARIGDPVAYAPFLKCKINHAPDSYHCTEQERGKFEYSVVCFLRKT